MTVVSNPPEGSDELVIIATPLLPGAAHYNLYRRHAILGSQNFLHIVSGYEKDVLGREEVFDLFSDVAAATKLMLMAKKYI